MYLLDINVWLALVFEAHQHHSRAKKWFDERSPRSCNFCRLTQQGFLRLSTNKSVFKDEAVTMSKAWQLYDALLKDERVVYLEEADSTESEWRAYTKSKQYSPKLWNDAYLLAFATSHNSQLATLDSRLKKLFSNAKVNLI